MSSHASCMTLRLCRPAACISSTFASNAIEKALDALCLQVAIFQMSGVVLRRGQWWSPVPVVTGTYVTREKNKKCGGTPRRGGYEQKNKRTLCYVLCRDPEFSTRLLECFGAARQKLSAQLTCRHSAVHGVEARRRVQKQQMQICKACSLGLVQLGVVALYVYVLRTSTQREVLEDSVFSAGFCY